MSMVKSIPDLERRTEEGSIYEGEERVITFRAATFQSIIDKVRGMAGDIVARTIFYQMGLDIGRKSFEYSKDEGITFESFVRILDAVLTLRGWGRFVSANKSESNTQVDYECIFQECIMCHKLTAQQPICDVVRGIFAAWLEALRGEKAQSSVETQCRAMGKDSCVFKITFAKDTR